MKRLKSILRKKEGTTLVETMVCLLLISIMLAMAASSLSAASHVFVRVQKTQYAQSILDTTMTELRTITKNETQPIPGETGASGILLICQSNADPLCQGKTAYQAGGECHGGKWQ